MGDPVAAVEKVFSSTSFVGSLLDDGQRSARAAPVDPQTRYLAKPRADGVSEGRARDALEKEKRKRYADYENTLLGRAGLGGGWAPGLSGVATPEEN
jgi:hypothetical protein